MTISDLRIKGTVRGILSVLLLKEGPLQCCVYRRKSEVYANVLCEFNAADVTFIPGKSKLFYVQHGFKKLECEYLLSILMFSVYPLFNDLKKKKVEVAGSQEYKETENINSVESSLQSHSFWVTLF